MNFKIWIAVAIVIALSFATYQYFYLKNAHSTFENYYTFRGCSKLLQKTDTWGTCQTKSNDTIKIVKYQDRWFLDGDLPCGFFCW